MTWIGKAVLVTGADGFIGSHLTEALLAEGANVRAFCFYNSNSSLGWLETIPLGARRAIDVRLGDIRDARFVEESCRGIDVVFHLAALVAIPYSYRAPESFVDTNIRGTLNVLEAVRRHACGRIVQTSTSEVYGTPDTLPITEAHPLKGQSPYSATKIAADKLCEAYYASFQVPVVTLRPFNTYGPRQSARAVIPTILSQLLSGEREIHLGNLKPKRDLTYVSDTVSGFLAAGLAPGIEGKTIQLGTGRTYSVEDIVRVAGRVCNLEPSVVIDASRFRPDRSEVEVLLSDPSCAHHLLGWRATIDLDDGLRRTAEWMEVNLDRFAPGSYAV